MTSYIESASVINYGVMIKINYRKYFSDKGVESTEHFTDFLDTRPIGNWTNIQFSEFEYVPYHQFIETFVHKNTKVLIKMASLAHDIFLNDASPCEMEWLLGKLCIIDNTFEPGRFNLRCTWQRDLLKDICLNSATYVIATCHNNKNLFRYYKTISSELKV